MLSDEERKAIDYLQLCYDLSTITNESLSKLGIVLNLIEKQSKEIEHQIEKRANQKKELAILNAKQIEFNKLVNTVNSYKGQFKRQQKEIEELKEKNRQGKMRIVQLENEITARIEDVNKYFTPNDKIKAKIEVLDKAIKVNRNSAKNSDRVTVRLINDKINELYKAKEVLQSLLEKE